MHDDHLLRPGRPDRADPLPSATDAGTAASDERAPAPPPVTSLRDWQRARLEAETRRLADIESQLVNLQLILRTDQARLAIDRLRFAVHGLCGTLAPTARTSSRSVAAVPDGGDDLDAPEPRLVRVK